MAIINSVVMGTAKNKVGEVVVATKNGRSVARKYQSDIEDRKSPAQLAQRARLANMTLVSQAFAPWLNNAFLSKGKYQSTVNAFASANMQLMDTTVAADAVSAIQAASARLDVAKGRFGLVTSNYTGGDIVFNFSSIASFLSPGDVVVFLSMDAGNGVVTRSEVTLTSTQITAGTVSSTISLGTGDLYAAFAYTKRTRKNSSAELMTV